VNLVKSIDRSDPKYKRNRAKIDRLIAINAGIYTPRKYTRPVTNKTADGVEYIELKIDEKMKENLDVDSITIFNIANSYEIRMVKNNRIFKTLRLDKELFEVYSKAMHAIQRSELK